VQYEIGIAAVNRVYNSTLHHAKSLSRGSVLK